MSDTVLRHWMMLRQVPRYPRKIDAASLARRLEDAGFDVSRRSIERDLLKLSAVFPLCCDDLHRPYGWSWMADATPFDLPAMDVHAALAFRMAAEHLRPLLPEVTRSHLDPHFQRAKAVLDALDDNVLANWPDKVRVMPSGQPMLPPAIDREVVEGVEAGLLAEKRLQIVYRRRGETAPRTYQVHPQALVWRDAVGYLLCTLWQYDDVVQLALHRMASVVVEAEPRRALPGFSVEAEMASGSFQFLLTDEPIALEVRLHAFAAVRLRETPLVGAQLLLDQPDGTVLLRATLADTVQLRTWLLSQGEYAQVLGPPELRQAIASSVRQMAAQYADEPAAASDDDRPPS